MCCGLLSVMLVLMPVWIRGNMAWRGRIEMDLIRGCGCGRMNLESLLMLAK